MIDRVLVKEFLWSRRYFMSRTTRRKLPFVISSRSRIQTLKPSGFEVSHWPVARFTIIGPKAVSTYGTRSTWQSFA